MFRRSAQSSGNNKPSNMAVKVVEYVASGGAGTKIDTVRGINLLNNEEVTVMLTSTGEAAGHAKRPGLETFASEKMNQHVAVGGAIAFDTVWKFDDGYKARWAQFLARDEENLKAYVRRGIVSVSAGVRADQQTKDETRWANVTIWGRPIQVADQAGLATVLEQLGDQMISAKASTAPVLRLVSPEGEVIDYAPVTQTWISEEKRRQSGKEFADAALNDQFIKSCLEKAAAGQGQLELIPTQKVQFSPKKMEGDRGKAVVGMARKFNDSENGRHYAMDCWYKKAPTDDNNFIDLVHIQVDERLDPLLRASEQFPEVRYSTALLAELQANVKTNSGPSSSVAKDGLGDPQPDPAPQQQANEPESDPMMEFENQHGFG